MKETKKQLKYISFLEEATGIEYNGKTKFEASKYISKNKNKVNFYDKDNIFSIIKGY